MFFSDISKTFVLTVCVCVGGGVCVSVCVGSCMCDTVHVCDTVRVYV